MVQTNMSTLNAQRFARAATRRPKYLLYFNKKREFLFELRSSFPSTRTLAYSYYRHASVGTQVLLLNSFEAQLDAVRWDFAVAHRTEILFLLIWIFNSELFGSERTRGVQASIKMRNHFHKSQTASMEVRIRDQTNQRKYTHSFSRLISN